MGFIKTINGQTYEPYDPYTYDLVTKEDIQNAANEKLYRIEEAEKEMGIPFLVLYNAVKYGFYDKDGNHYEPGKFVITFGEDFIVIQELYFEDLDAVMDTTGKKWYIKDYRKTWALRREELDKVLIEFCRGQINE